MDKSKITTAGNITSGDRKSAELRKKMDEDRFNKKVKTGNNIGLTLQERKDAYARK